MRVEISHNVDRVLDQVYNFLTYDFVTSDARIRARAYTHSIGEVAILGRLGADGSLPAEVQAFQIGAPREGLTEEAARAAMTAFDPRGTSDFDAVLDYLRDRFSEIKSLGPTGYETVATGFSEEELAQREEVKLGDGFYREVVIEADLDGGSQ